MPKIQYVEIEFGVRRREQNTYTSFSKVKRGT